MMLPNQITGNIGLFWTCYRLSQLGWNAMPTSRNAQGIDVVAFSTDGKKMITIQVKTLSEKGAIPVGKDLGRIDVADWWVIVNNVASRSPRGFIMLPEEVKALSHSHERGAKQYWLSAKHYDCDQFRERWDRIGNPT